MPVSLWLKPVTANGRDCFIRYYFPVTSFFYQSHEIQYSLLQLSFHIVVWYMLQKEGEHTKTYDVNLGWYN